jgi:hypothetical protein
VFPVPQSAGGAHHPGPAPSGHPAADEAAAGPGPEQPTSGQRSSIGRELDRLVDDPEERLGFLAWFTGRQISDLGDLTRTEAGKAVTVLKGCGSHEDLVKLYGTRPGSDG